jgi:hypothetical protein
MITNHTFAGTVQALQYTGSNSAEVITALGTGWHVYTCALSNILVIYQAGGENFPSGTVVNPTDWLVSNPAYGTSTPSLVSFFQVIQNSNFTQQYV